MSCSTTTTTRGVLRTGSASRVQVDVRRLESFDVTIVEEDLVDVANAHRHDPAKLAAARMRIQQQDRAERPRQRRVSQPTASAG